MRADRSPCYWPAPAKLNLHLHVTGRRTDGYHELQTLFQLLDWGDEVGIEVTRESRVTRVTELAGLPAEEDLVVHAARILQRATASRRGARLDCRKRIPMGAGLGGGSSDAATVLLVLNRLWDCELELEDLAELGARLGADVPVFVHGNSALATGVGEQLLPVILGPRHYVLVFPGTVISTRDVFADPALRRDSPPLPLADALAGGGRNDCAEVVFRRYPEVARAAQVASRWGRPQLTGTGSTLFLEMDSREQAIRATREMKSLYNVRAVSGVDRSPLHEMLETGGS